MVEVTIKAEFIQSTEHPIDLSFHHLPSEIVRANIVDIFGWVSNRRLVLENEGEFYFARYAWEEGEKNNHLDFYFPKDAKRIERWAREYLGDEILLDMEHKFRLELSIEPTDHKTLSLGSYAPFKSFLRRIKKLANGMFEQHILSLEINLSGSSFIGFPPEYRFKIYLHSPEYEKAKVQVEERDALWHYIYDYKIYLPSWEDIIPTLKEASPVLFT